jgi:hypothetical protein
VSWVGWKDDLAEIDHYEYDVFELTTDGIQLNDIGSYETQNQNGL